MKRDRAVSAALCILVLAVVAGSLPKELALRNQYDRDLSAIDIPEDASLDGFEGKYVRIEGVITNVAMPAIRGVDVGAGPDLRPGVRAYAIGYLANVEVSHVIHEKEDGTSEIKPGFFQYMLIQDQDGDDLAVARVLPESDGEPGAPTETVK